MRNISAWKYRYTKSPLIEALNPSVSTTLARSAAWWATHLIIITEIMPSIRIFMRDRWTNSSPHSSAALFWVRLFFAVLFLRRWWVTAGALSLQLLSVACAPPHEKPLIPAWRSSRASSSRTPPTPPFSSLCEFVSPPSWRHRPHSNLSCQQRTGWQTGRHKRSWSNFDERDFNPCACILFESC